MRDPFLLLGICAALMLLAILLWVFCKKAHYTGVVTGRHKTLTGQQHSYASEPAPPPSCIWKVSVKADDGTELLAEAHPVLWMACVNGTRVSVMLSFFECRVTEVH